MQTLKLAPDVAANHCYYSKDFTAEDKAFAGVLLLDRVYARCKGMDGMFVVLETRAALLRELEAHGCLPSSITYAGVRWLLDLTQYGHFVGVSWDGYVGPLPASAAVAA